MKAEMKTWRKTRRKMRRKTRIGFWLLSLAGLMFLSAFILQPSSLLAQDRSSQWPEVRASHLKLEPYCALCGTTKDLEVHHILPVHLAPKMELVEVNLITLCRHCHFEAGHLGNWTNAVPEVRAIVGETGKRLWELRQARNGKRQAESGKKDEG